MSKHHFDKNYQKITTKELMALLATVAKITPGSNILIKKNHCEILIFTEKKEPVHKTWREQNIEKTIFKKQIKLWFYCWG